MPDCLKPVQHNKSFSEWKHFFRQVNVCSQSGKLHAHLKLNQLKNVAEFSSANVLKWKLDSFPLVNFCSGPWEPKCERECVCVSACVQVREREREWNPPSRYLPIPALASLSLSFTLSAVKLSLEQDAEHSIGTSQISNSWHYCMREVRLCSLSTEALKHCHGTFSASLVGWSYGPKLSWHRSW